MNILKLLTSLFGITAIVLSGTALWISKTFGTRFGNIYFEQILWHVLESPFDGIDSNYIKRGIRYFLIILCLCLIWIFLVHYQRQVIGILRAAVFSIKRFLQSIVCLIKEYIPEKQNKSLSKILFSIAMVYLLGITVFIDKKFHIYEYISVEIERLLNKDSSGEDQIKKLYTVPIVHEIHFENKKSIVLIMAESMENSFNDPMIQQVLMPHMKKFQEMAEHNDATINIYGTGWTIASLTGWFFGLPLKLPHGIDGNKYMSKKGFLPSAESIFDILKKNGYELVLVMGSDKRYSGMDILFSGHGSFRILDKSHFAREGWSLEKYGGTGGGFTDAFVLERAHEEYKKLKDRGSPFVLFVETIDTHSPAGFCPADRKKYNDIRDAIIELDANLAHFSEKIWDDDIIYIVSGDHFFMGNPEFLSQIKGRTIFNLFHGDLPPVSEKKRHESFSALDMAPTLLHAAGARWDSDQFGLGISLFSNQSTLLERYGPEEFNKILGSWSPLYSTFYERKTNE